MSIVHSQSTGNTRRTTCEEGILDKLLLRIPEAYEASSLGRSKFYELIRDGRIRTVRIGRSVRVPADSLRDFVRDLQAEGGPK